MRMRVPHGGGSYSANTLEQATKFPPGSLAQLGVWNAVDIQLFAWTKVRADLTHHGHQAEFRPRRSASVRCLSTCSASAVAASACALHAVASTPATHVIQASMRCQSLRIPLCATMP